MLTHPLILTGLLAVAIPIAVHLFNFRRYRKVYFSNVDYLSELHQQTRKQSELMRWLILASRILVIVFLVLAFAQPVIPGSGKRLNTGGTCVSIYLDNSFSMANTNSEGTLLEMGRNKVKEIVAAYERDDQFQLLTNEGSGTEFRWLSKEELLDELENVEIGPRTTSITNIGEKQYDFLRQSHAANQHCYIISDFQKSTSDLSAWSSDTNIQTTFVVIQSSTLNNLSIDSISLNAPVFYLGNNVEVNVTLTNSGKENLEQVQVKLIADNAPRGISTLDIPAEGKASTTLKMTADQAKTMQCRVEIVDYPITFDDQFFFSINVNSKIDVALIGERNEYIERLFDQDSTIRFIRMAESEVNYQALNQNNMIVLNEIHSISSGMAQTLQSWVEEGGTLFVIPDEKPDNSYNAALSAWKAPLLEEWQSSHMSVTSIDLDNGLLRGVFNGNTDEMELPTIQGFHPMRSQSSTTRSTIMSLADGNPFLCCTPIGNGIIYLLCTPLQEKTTDWPRQALFVPVVYNMALFSRQMGLPYYSIGYEGMVRLGNRYEMPHLTAEGCDILPDIRQVSGKSCMLLHNQIEKAGNYLISEGDTKEGISFNYCRKESNMESYSEKEIASLISDYGLKECSIVPNPQKSLETYIRQQRDDKPLWHWCIIASLLFLLVEILLLRKLRKSKANA